ncbi:MAG: cytochrome c3 family protein [Myxococcota bacterium]
MTLGVALVFMGGQSWAGAQPMSFELGPSEAVYPPTSPSIRFSHRLHLSERKNGCQECHRSSDGEGPPRANHDACRGCHAPWLDAEAQACSQCHLREVRRTSTTTVVATSARSAPNLRFSHAQHVRFGDACERCHPRMEGQSGATPSSPPTMDRCLDCHHERRAPAECGSCHPEDLRGKLVQRFSTGLLVPRRFSRIAAHVGDFAMRHGPAARQERVLCRACHDDAECLFCHDGMGRDVRYHPDPWILQHGLRGAADQGRCQACHRVQTFCLSCHQRSGVAVFGSFEDPLARPSTHRERPNDRSSRPIGPHPMAADGWLDPGSPRSHGPAARRRIQSCASCHQEQFCILCHGSGFQGRNGPNPAANPHGSNAERLRSSPAARQNARACLKCHSPLDSRWRPVGSGR